MKFLQWIAIIIFSKIMPGSTSDNSITNDGDSCKVDRRPDNRGGFLCGVVEGFYGRPWTTEQRKDLFSKMQVRVLEYYSIKLNLNVPDYNSLSIEYSFRKFWIPYQIESHSIWYYDQLQTEIPSTWLDKMQVLPTASTSWSV